MTMRAFAKLLSLSVAIHAPGAWADEPESQELVKEAPVCAAPERAAAGVAAFDARRYQEAIVAFEAALACLNDPDLVYNLARSHEELGFELEASDPSGALVHAMAAEARFRAYSSEMPDQRRLVSVRQRLQRIGVLVALLRSRTQAQGRPEDAIGPIPPSPPQPMGPWILFGSGAAILASGAVLGGISVHEFSQAEDAPSGREAADHIETSNGTAIAANVTFVVGGSLAVAGAAWLLAAFLGTQETAALNRVTF